MWAVWCCISVSTANPTAKVSLQHQTQTTAANKIEEQLSPEVQNKSVAWSEPTASRGTSANAAEKILTAILGTDRFCLLHLSSKSFRIQLPFSSLSEQFRILPNAP